MNIRTIKQIDYRIARLQALMKQLRAERRVAVLREKHEEIKSRQPDSIVKGVRP